MADPSKDSVQDWLRQLFAWDTAEKQRIVRAAMASGYGLCPDGYARPFPGSTTVIQTGQGGNGVGKTIAAILGAGALTGVLGLGAGWLLAPKPAATVPAASPEGTEWEIRWKLENGEWKTEVQPVKGK